MIALMIAVPVTAQESAQERSAVLEPAFAQPQGRPEDPSLDGWDTEVWSARAEDQLERLAEWLVADSTGPLPRDLVDEEFEIARLGPPNLRLRFDDDTISVHTAGESAGVADGIEGLLSDLRRLRGRLDGHDDLRAHFKLFRIDPESGGFTTTAYFEAFGRRDGGSRQIDSVWRCRWRGARPQARDAPTDAPTLVACEAGDYEETETDLPSGTLFEDVTRSALGHNPSYSDQLLESPEHWLSRLTKAQGYSKNGWQGVSIADVDSDGLEDLFVPQPGGLPNRLYIQREDGTFDDRSATSGVDFLERSLAGLFVDLDNDGDADLVLAHRPAVLVLENDGRGGLHEVRFVAGAIPDSHSLTAADYDLDGDLDLYVCAYRRQADERGIASPVPYHDANNGGRNVLLRNDGDFVFSDVTTETGLDVNNRRFSLAASWEDFDNDGDADLYVANDYGRNNLFENLGRAADGKVRFRDIAAQAGVEDISSGMSVSWADYDRDGSMDVYVGNMFSAAGNRITYQRRFERDRERAGELGDVRRMARGNSLFRGLRSASGTDGFEDVSEAEGVTMGRWAWSSVFADVNNDGWQDIIVANGNLTQTDPDDL